MLKQFKPLNMFTKQTDELKELIAKYPNYPIVVMVSSDVVCDDYYGWWYAPDLSFSIGEILDCAQDIDYEKTYTDRDELKEDIIEKLSCDDENDGLSDDEFNQLVEEFYQEYEPYWKKVIQIRADV